MGYHHSNVVPRIAAQIVAAIMASLSGIHLYWASGGRWGRGRVIPTKAGEPLLRPSRGGTIAVAAGLGAAGLTVLGAHYTTERGHLARAMRAGTWLISAVFLLRAVGDFRSMGLFKRVKRTPFADLDTRVFVPLCLVISVVSALAAWTSPVPDAAAARISTSSKESTDATA